MIYPIPFITQSTQERVHRPFIQGFTMEALQCATETPSFAGPNLSKWFRAQRKLGSRDRKIVAELIYTLIRFERWFVKAGLLTEPLHTNSQLHAVFEWWQSPSTTPQFDLATHLSIPDWMSPHLSAIDDPTKFVTHYQARAPIDIRCNLQKTTRRKLSQQLRRNDIHTERIQNTAAGLRIKENANLTGQGLFKRGLFEIQDAASQYFIEHLRPLITPKTTVLDYCAGAGGKSLALAALGATVYAHEPRSSAINELQKRAQRAGVKIQIGLPKHPVDIVVVDAPCSGTGRLRREPTVRWKWQAQPPLDWVPIQQQILQQAQSFVKPTGQIAYATCSILPPENQHTIDGWHATRQTIYGHQRDCDGFSWTIFQPLES